MLFKTSSGQEGGEEEDESKEEEGGEALAWRTCQCEWELFPRLECGVRHRQARRGHQSERGQQGSFSFHSQNFS